VPPRSTRAALTGVLSLLLGPTATAQGQSDDEAQSPAGEATAPDADALATPPLPRDDDPDGLSAPPEPVPGRAVVEHEPGELLPPEWRPRRRPRSPSTLVDRTRTLPGDVVARPLTLPRGTFVFAFDATSVFLDTAPLTTFVPSFALGVTEALELGVGAPTRYDQGEDAWTALDPAFRAAYTLFDDERFELAARAVALAPAASSAAPFLELGAPVLWHAHRRVRVDTGVAVEIAFDDDLETSLRVPLGLTVQAAPWLFVGAQGTADVGLSGGRDTGVDGEVFVGLTVQRGGQGYFDVVGRFFIDDLGAGVDGNLSNGGGFAGGVRFYPEAW